MEYQKGEYTISTDRRKMQVSVIHEYLANDSYWSQGIPRKKVEQAIRNSACFGVFHGKKQVGFCRVVTDYVRFAWLADVFILPGHRGKGLSKWMMQTLMEFPDFQEIRRWMLGTRDAHGLYRQFGFAALQQPDNIMDRPFSGDW